MHLDIKNKKIVLTGAGGFLGTEFSKAILASGGFLVATDIDMNKLNCLSETIKKNKLLKNFIIRQLDITNELQVKNFAIEMAEININGLINNAALNPKVEETKKQNFSRLENYSLNSWNMEISVGLTGAFLMSKYLGNNFAKNSNGIILNISSDLGIISPDQRLYEDANLPKDQQNVKPVTYSVIKSGLIGLTKYISTYWAKNNVRCNAICPGGVENSQNKEFIEKVNQLIPLGRMANKEEYNALLIYLMSDHSSYVNGAIWSIDGGRTVL